MAEGSPRLTLQRASDWLLLALSLFALLDGIVLSSGRPTLAGEGRGAEVFHQIVVALVPPTVLFLATAEWSSRGGQGMHRAGRLLMAALICASLYFLQQVVRPQ